jgi:hypothetical protein
MSYPPAGGSSGGPRPGDWYHFGYDNDPLPGDPWAVSSQAGAYRDVASAIDDQVRVLHQIAESHDWVGVKGSYAGALAEAAREMGDELAKIQGRFDTVASQLRTWQPVLEEGRTTTWNLLIQAENAQSDLDRNPAPGPLADDATDDDKTKHDDARKKHDSAAGDLTDAKTKFRTAMEHIHSVASSVAKAIKDASDDNVKDSWWDSHVRKWIHDHADLLKLIADVCTWIATGLLIAALFLSGAGLLLLLAAIATGVALLIHTALAAQGDGSWLDVALDVIALATMGTSALLSAGAKATVAARAIGSEKGLMAALKTADVFKVTEIFKVAQETRVSFMTEDAIVSITTRAETTVVRESLVAVGDAAKMNEAAVEAISDVEKLRFPTDLSKALVDYGKGVDRDFLENTQALRTLLHDMPGDQELLQALSRQQGARLANIAGAATDITAKGLLPAFTLPGHDQPLKPALLPKSTLEWIEEHTVHGLSPEVQNLLHASAVNAVVPGSGPVVEYLEHH